MSPHRFSHSRSGVGRGQPPIRRGAIDRSRHAPGGHRDRYEGRGRRGRLTPSAPAARRMPAEHQAAPIEAHQPQSAAGTEVSRALLACLVLGKKFLPGLTASDLRHLPTSINAMDRSVSDLGHQGQGVVAGALTPQRPRGSRSRAGWIGGNIPLAATSPTKRCNAST